MIVDYGPDGQVVGFALEFVPFADTSSPPAFESSRTYRASGLGRSWIFTAFGRFSLPPSRWYIVRVP